MRPDRAMRSLGQEPRTAFPEGTRRRTGPLAAARPGPRAAA